MKSIYLALLCTVLFGCQNTPVKPPESSRDSPAELVSARLVNSGGLFLEVKNNAGHPIRFLDVPLGSGETYRLYSFIVTDSDGKEIPHSPKFAPVIGEKIVTIEPGSVYRRKMALGAHVSKGSSKGPYRVRLQYQGPKIFKSVYRSKHKPPPDVNITFITEPITIEDF